VSAANQSHAKLATTLEAAVDEPLIAVLEHV
jgi:hypothetical protein